MRLAVTIKSTVIVLTIVTLATAQPTTQPASETTPQKKPLAVDGRAVEAKADASKADGLDLTPPKVEAAGEPTNPADLPASLPRLNFCTLTLARV